MLTNDLRSIGTDILINCIRPGLQGVVGGKSSDPSRFSLQFSPGTHLELDRL